MTVLLERVHQVLQRNPKKLKSKAKTVVVLQEHHKNFQEIDLVKRKKIILKSFLDGFPNYFLYLIL